jgi:hypothetical protein
MAETVRRVQHKMAETVPRVQYKMAFTIFTVLFNFFAHAILIRLCRSQIFELCHTFKEFITHSCAAILPCILFTEHKHRSLISLSICLYIKSRGRTLPPGSEFLRYPIGPKMYSAHKK